MRVTLPGRVPVTSAGTRARAGDPIWPAAARELERRGVSSLGFDAYPVTRALLDGADLVLTATRQHRDELLGAHPEVLRRIFTWRELAWLVEGMGHDAVPGRTASDRLRVLPALAAARRGLLAVPRPVDLDVPDPVGGPESAMSVAAEVIDLAIRGIVRVLR